MTTGTCTKCGRTFNLTADGKVPVHARYPSLGAGSRKCRLTETDPGRVVVREQFNEARGRTFFVVEQDGDTVYSSTRREQAESDAAFRRRTLDAAQGR